MNESRQYMAVWDCNGLESIFDVTEALELEKKYEQEKIWDILSDRPHKPKPNFIPLNYLLMRARFNTHRNYEIYEFESTLSMDELKDAFHDSPQFIVDWIRKNGYKVYGNHSKKSNKVIQ